MSSVPLFEEEMPHFNHGLKAFIRGETEIKLMLSPLTDPPKLHRYQRHV